VLKTERRAVARYRVKIAVQIEIDEYEFDAMSIEISLLGLSAVCDGNIANKVFNQHIKVTPGENIAADIQLKISQGRGLVKTIKCQARVISVSRISQSSYVVGFNIIEFDSEGQELWQNFISSKH
jgi:hypothetical protein